MAPAVPTPHEVARLLDKNLNWSKLKMWDQFESVYDFLRDKERWDDLPGYWGSEA